MRIIVTGGAGFIGSSFINHMKANYECSILCVDSLTYASNLDNILPVDIEFLKKDICEVTPEDLGEYDYVVNFAAETHVDNSITNGRPFLKSNVDGVFNLLECARQNKNLKKFVQISTDEVYGDMADDPAIINLSATELSHLQPSSYYSSTKAAGDLLVMSANRTFGVPYLITRTCNNFGSHQHPEKFLPKMRKCILEGTSIPVYGDGKQSRQWIHVDDNVRVVVNLMLDESVVNTVRNITSNIEYKNIEIVNMVSSFLGRSISVDYVQDRLGHDRVYRLRSIYPQKAVQQYTDLKDYLKETCSTI